MATHDYEIDNSTGANVRIDINNVLKAILTNNSGTTDPATVISTNVGSKAFSFWADTNSSPAVLKIRNAADNAWIELFQLDGTLTLEDGSASAAALGFRTDLDTGLFLDAAGELAITAAGTKRMTVTATKGVLINTDTEGNASADNLTVADTGHAGITIRSGSTSTGNIFFSDGTSGNAELAGYLQYDHNSNKLYIGAGESNAIFVDASTSSDIRVGINNTNVGSLNASADDLVIEKSANCGITIKSGTTSDGNIFFADGTSGSAQFSGFIQYNHQNDEMRLGSSGDNTLILENSSNNRDVHVVDGDIVFDTSGRGIDFSATSHVTGVESELLHDYEHGTWVPSFTQGVTGGGYSIQTGNYTKVGRLVFVTCRIDGNGLTATSDNLLIGGLPFTSCASNTAGGMYMAFSDNLFSGSSGTNLALTFIVNTNANVVEIFNGDGTQQTGSNMNDVNRNIHLIGTYHAT